MNPLTIHLHRLLRASLLAGLSTLILVPARADGDSSAPAGVADGPTPAPPPPPAGGAVEQLGEVTVTAEKQVSTEQTTPISMAVEPSEALLDRGISDAATLLQETPGVSLKSNGPGQTEFEMRGMTSSGGNSPTVGFYLDDVALTAPAGAQNGKVVMTPPLFDVDRTEVLRGPQGTIYGSGSMGGTFKVISKEPDLGGFSGALQSTLSGTEGGGFNHADNGMVNIPVIPNKLAIRLVATEARTSGWIDRIVLDPFPDTNAAGSVRGAVLDAPVEKDYKGSNADQSESLRGTLLWQPTPRLTVKATAIYMSDYQDGISAFDDPPGTLAHYEVFDIPEPKSDKEAIESLNIDYQFDGFDATLVTAYWARRSTQVEEASEMFDNPAQALAYYANTGAPNPGFYGPDGTGQAYGYEDDPTRQFSAELRLSSSGKGRLQWVAGAYFSHYWSSWNFTGTTPNYSAYQDIGTGAPATTPDWFDAYSPTTMEQYAAYGNLSYAVAPKLRVGVGLRVTDFDYQFESQISGWGSALGAAAPSVTPATTVASVAVDPKFNVDYAFSPDFNVYATAAEGFRPGGGNATYPTAGPLWSAAFKSMNYSSGKWPTTYDSDSVWSYEAGAKTRWLGRRLMVNASLYYEDWKNIQLLAYPDDWAFNINGNHATIYGGDVEVRALLGGGFELAGSVGYLHDDLDGGPHWIIQPNNVLPDVANVNGNINLSYSTPVRTLRLKSEIETVYVGSRYSLNFLYYPGYEENGEYTRLPGYMLTNFRIGIESQQQTWSVTLFVNNLTDKHASLEYLYSETQPSAAFNRVVGNQPLTAGVDMSYRF